MWSFLKEFKYKSIPCPSKDHAIKGIAFAIVMLSGASIEKAQASVERAIEQGDFILEFGSNAEFILKVAEVLRLD